MIDTFLQSKCQNCCTLSGCEPGSYTPHDRGNMAEWLRRLIRNQLEAIPREFESLCCRVFLQICTCECSFFGSKSVYGIEFASLFMYAQVLVAQRIAHQTSNLGVAGSNPVEHVLQQCCGPLV